MLCLVSNELSCCRARILLNCGFTSLILHSQSLQGNVWRSLGFDCPNSALQDSAPLVSVYLTEAETVFKTLVCDEHYEERLVWRKVNLVLKAPI